MIEQFAQPAQLSCGARGDKMVELSVAMEIRLEPAVISGRIK
jgi:hypothetical protein